MQYLNKKLSGGNSLYNVRQETSEDIKHKEIETSTKDVIIQADMLKEIAKKMNNDDLQFSMFAYPDDKLFNVTHKLLDNAPVNKKSSIATKIKAMYKHQYYNI